MSPPAFSGIESGTEPDPARIGPGLDFLLARAPIRCRRLSRIADGRTCVSGSPFEDGGHEAYAELAWIEALGALDPDDRARLAAHLRAGCPPCLELLRGGREVVVGLAHLFAPAAPSNALGARLRAAARRAPDRGAPSHRAPRRARIAGVASWIALAASLGFLVFSFEQRARERTEHAATLAAIASADTRQVALAGEAGAHARAFVSGARVTLVVADLAAPPGGSVYQLWAIEAGTPRSAGVFASGADGRALHRARLASAVAPDAAFAVTLEPAGGVPQPTGPIVLAQR
jgi:anti-sigma-K factor RskA